MGRTWRRERMNDADDDIGSPSSYKVSADEEERRKSRGKKDYCLSGILSDDYKPTYITTIGNLEEKKEEVDANSSNLHK